MQFFHSKQKADSVGLVNYMFGGYTKTRIFVFNVTPSFLKGWKYILKPECQRFSQDGVKTIRFAWFIFSLSLGKRYLYLV